MLWGSPVKGPMPRATLWSLPVNGEIAEAMKSLDIGVKWATTCVCVAGARCKSLEGGPGVPVQLPCPMKVQVDSSHDSVSALVGDGSAGELRFSALAVTSCREGHLGKSF